MTDITKTQTARILRRCAICVTLLLGSCSVPTSEPVQPVPAAGQQEIDNRQALIDGTITTASTTVPDNSDQTVEVRLYFVGPNDQLERVSRVVPIGTKTGDVLDSLARGPLPEEEAEFDQLTSRITEALAPVPIPRDGETEILTVQVRSEAGLVQQLVEDQAGARLIVSQIVCTVVNLRTDISGVRLVDETNEEIAVNDVDGQLIAGSARASHFNDCMTGRDFRQGQIESEQNESTTT